MTQTYRNSLNLVTFVIFALAPSMLMASPLQDGVFSRTDDARAESAESSANTEVPQQQQATSSVAKESEARIDQQSDGWFAISDDDSKVDVRLPGKPKYKEVTFSPIAGRSAVVNHIYNSLTADKQISVDYSWMDLHEAPVGRALKEALDGAVKGSVVNVFGELNRMDPIKSGQVDGRDFQFRFSINTPDGKTHMLSGHSRVFIQGNRRYQLNVIAPEGKEDEDMVKKLFESLVIKNNAAE
jgi:hypothetical protein